MMGKIENDAYFVCAKCGAITDEVGMVFGGDPKDGSLYACTDCANVFEKQMEGFMQNDKEGK